MARTSYISIRSGFSSAISLKQQSTGRHVAPLWHIILWFQPIFVITPKCYALSGEAENTNFIIFDLSGLWLVLYHTHGRYTTHYTINVVQGSILSNKFCFWQPKFKSGGQRDHQRNWGRRPEILDNWIQEMAIFLFRPQSSSHLHGHQSLIFKWYANGRVIGISGYVLAGSFHIYNEVSCTHYYLVFKHFLQKGPCNSTQFINS